MKLEQNWQPDYSYCVMCGTPTEKETCSKACLNRLTSIRYSINTRKRTERQGVKQYDEKTIRQFNKVQDIIGK